jgi:phage protein D
VTIELGYAGNLQPMIDGKIQTLSSNFFSAGAPTLSVEGSDVSSDLLVTQKSSPQLTFNHVKYSDIVQTLASEAGLSATVDATSETHEEIVKRSGVNYLNFIRDLGRRVNYEFYVLRKTLYFVQPKVQDEEILTLAWGQHLISFNPTTNTTRLATEVEVRSWNPTTKEEIVGRASAGEEQTQESGRRKGSEIAQELYGEAKRVIYRPVSSSEEATNIAHAELNKASNQLVEGRGETFGVPGIRPGVTIKLEGLGTRFSGKYYLTDTTHTIDGSGYKTRFTARRNAI